MACQPAVLARHTTPYDVAPAYPAVHFLEEVAHQRVAVGLEVTTDLWDDKGTRGAGCWVTTRLAAWYFEVYRRLAVAVFAVVPLRRNHPHRHTHSNHTYVSTGGGATVLWVWEAHQGWSVPLHKHGQQGHRVLGATPNFVQDVQRDAASSKKASVGRLPTVPA